MAGSFSVVDNSWELIDPNPDIHLLFSQFNESFFWGKLSAVYVQWSPRMTLCAGLCRYHGRNRECSIHLSKPLLSYRPRKDLVETLLHEMIHAYLFVADNDRERESHGPKFHEHMYRINRLTGANITVYHTFHDEVSHFKTHWWKCNGPCQNRSPFYGIVKRSMNRAPGPNDFWFKDHQKNCGGTFIKIKEPSPKKGVKRKKEAGSQKISQKSPEANENKNKITNYFTSPTGSSSVGTATSANTTAIPNSPPKKISQTASISDADPFTGRGYVLGSIGNNNGASTSSGMSFQTLPRKLAYTNTSSSTSLPSGASSSSVRNGGTSTQPPRRGEHPLLAKWVQNRKDSFSVPGRPTAKKPETIVRPTNNFFGNGSSSLSSSTLGFSASKTSNVKQNPPIEVIDID